MNWQTLKNASIDDIIGWAETLPWCLEMASCTQDSEWHAEGDVWTHTKMVLRELPKLDDWNSLRPNEQTILVMTALFHDIAKPMTTEVDSETGRVRSPKHAIKGEVIARSILRDLDCDLETREQIARLVRFHGRPAFLLEKEEPTHEVIRLSWLLSNRLLYLFALADTRGRDTNSITRPEENLHFWKMIAEEENCFEQPYPFATDHTRFHFARSERPNLHYVPYEEFRCDVTMLAGLPGSGKETWIREHLADRPVVSLDEMREEMADSQDGNQGAVAHAVRERCREYLREQQSFVFNATNTTLQHRARWLDLFADFQARIEIIYIEPTLGRILQQNRERENRIPERILRKLAEKCEPPTWLECHRLKYVGAES